MIYKDETNQWKPKEVEIAGSKAFTPPAEDPVQVWISDHFGLLASIMKAS